MGADDALGQHAALAAQLCGLPDLPGPVFSLGEALALLPGQPTPPLQESLVQLGTWTPLAQDAKVWAFITRVTVFESTLRRTTAGAGTTSETV